MKNLLRVIVLAFVSQLLIADLSAQGYTSLQTQLGIPSGDFRDYIENLSYRGLNIEYNYKLNRAFSIGAASGWNAFYERKPFATYPDGTASLSGVQYRYSNVLPIHFIAQYYFPREGNWEPYAGLGVGTLFANRIIDMGLYRWEEEAWRFSVRPELGLIYSPWHFAGLKASAKYNYVVKNPDIKEGHSYWIFGFGVVLIK